MVCSMYLNVGDRTAGTNAHAKLAHVVPAVNMLVETTDMLVSVQVHGR